MSSTDPQAVGRIDEATKILRMPFQSPTPLCHFVITADTSWLRAVFRLGRLWDEVPKLVFNVFALLGWAPQRDWGATQQRRTS